MQFSYNYSITEEKPLVHGAIEGHSADYNIYYRSMTSTTPEEAAELLTMVGRPSTFNATRWSARVVEENVLRPIFVYKDPAYQEPLGYVNIGFNNFTDPTTNMCNVLEWGAHFRDPSDTKLVAQSFSDISADYIRDAKSKGLLPNYNFVFGTLSHDNPMAIALQAEQATLKANGIDIFTTLDQVEEVLGYHPGRNATNGVERFINLGNNSADVLGEWQKTDEGGQHHYAPKLAFLMAIETPDNNDTTEIDFTVLGQALTTTTDE
jgi:hypothetical protein